MKPAVTIYHNPRCSKSRAALALLQERGVEARIIEYLKTPPSAEELGQLLKKLGLKPEQIIRTGEDVYKEKFRGKSLSDPQWVAALAAYPVLMERPIVVKGARAVVARPAEKLLELL